MGTTAPVVNYNVPTGARPRTFTYEPPDGSPRTTARIAPHGVQVRDIRHQDRRFSLDADGFAVVRFEERLPSDLIHPNRVGETCNVAFSPDHRWHDVKEQRPDEALLVKCYDSRAGAARCAPHTAFLEPRAPDGLPPQESIELRTLVFHKE